MSRPAGAFGAWLEAMRAVLRGEQEADVPCDGCVGCCVSSYPIPVRPTDVEALERIPSRHLHLPVTPGDTARMGFREDGTCPMLEAGQCTIYPYRPRTCRDYDCRIYAAAGLLPDGERPVIQERVREWEFTIADEQDRRQAQSVRTAAHFIRAQAALFPSPMRAHSATAVAVLAVKTCELFSDGAMPAPDAVPGMVARVIAAARAFDQA